jgi:hypothetical protein
VDAARDEFLALPDSPRICTGAWLRASLSICARRRCMAGVSPMSSSRAALSVAQRLSSSRAALTRLRSFSRRDGFADEIEGAGLERPDSAVDVAVGRDHGHGQFRVVGLDVLDEIDTVAIGQAHVRQAQLQRLAFEARSALGEVRGADGFQAHSARVISRSSRMSGSSSTTSTRAAVFCSMLLPH